MQTYYCKNGCCPIKIKTYNPVPTYFNRQYLKAGVFIYDPVEDRVLLVQSRGNLWGPPKGSLNIGEEMEECAVREVAEETGLHVSPVNFTKYVKIKNKAVYYYLEKDTCDINIQDSTVNNDANGIAWIKMSCLENAITDGNIVLNHYAKIVFRILMKKTFSTSNWIIVKRKKEK